MSDISRLKSAFAVVACLALAACGNILKEFATKDSNDAYLYDAQTAINGRDYDLALEKLNALTPAYQARRDVVTTTAAAYAGRCGLDFLAVVRAILDQPSLNLFSLLVQNFKNATTGSIDDCAAAVALMRTLTPGDDFTRLSADEALFMAITAIAHIGATLGTYADLNHDGTPDPAFDSCNTTKFPDARARAVGVSLNLVVGAVTASNNQTLGASIAGVAAACAALPSGSSFCGIYDPTAFTVPEVKVLNGLLASRDAPGLGTCANTFANCVCN